MEKCLKSRLKLIFFPLEQDRYGHEISSLDLDEHKKLQTKVLLKF